MLKKYRIVLLLVVISILLSFAACELDTDYEITIIFETNGGSLIESYTIKKGDDTTMPEDPTKEGYRFDGWYVDNVTFNDSAALDNKFISSNITLYAKWIKVYTIGFITDVGDSIDNIILDENYPLVLPTVDTITGHTFLGWYYDAEYENAYDSELAITDNINLYAKWDAIDYSLSIVRNNIEAGSINIESSYNYGDNVTLTVTTNTGYTWVGLYDDEDLITSDNTYSFTMPDENIVYQAIWSINQYTITYQTNGGDSISPVTQDYKTQLLSPTSPRKPFYKFEGWFTDEDCEEAFQFFTVFESEVVYTAMPAYNFTLYAKWGEQDGKDFLGAYTSATDTVYTVDITNEVSMVYYAFVPTEKAYYKIESYGNLDTFGVMYINNMLSLPFFFNDDGGEDANFSMERQLDAGQLYYIVVGLKDTQDVGSFTFDIVKTKDADVFPLDSFFILKAHNISLIWQDLVDYSYFADSHNDMGAKALYLENDFLLLLACDAEDDIDSIIDILNSEVMDTDFPFAKYYRVGTTTGNYNFIATDLLSINLIFEFQLFPPHNNYNYYNTDNDVLIRYASSDTSFVVPNTVEIIGSFAFSYCHWVSSITITSSVDSIGAGAFVGCEQLTTVYLERPVSEGITEGNLDMFINCPLLQHIYVADEDSLLAYKAAPFWSDYADIIAVKP